MPTYSDKIKLLPEVTAVMRNLWAAQVEKGKLTHELAQHKLDTLESILHDYGHKKYVTYAGILAGDTIFKIFVGWSLNLNREATNQEAKEFIWSQCGIESRKQLGYPKNKEARVKFDQLRQNFNDFKKYRQNG